MCAESSLACYVTRSGLKRRNWDARCHRRLAKPRLGAWVGNHAKRPRTRGILEEESRPLGQYQAIRTPYGSHTDARCPGVGPDRQENLMRNAKGLLTSSSAASAHVTHQYFPRQSHRRAGSLRRWRRVHSDPVGAIRLSTGQNSTIAAIEEHQRPWCRW